MQMKTQSLWIENTFLSRFIRIHSEIKGARYCLSLKREYAWATYVVYTKPKERDVINAPV